MSAKTGAPYWSSRVRKPFRRMVNDKPVDESPFYAVEMQYLGRKLALSLHTANKQIAAEKAAEIYVSLTTVGYEATLAKYRPKPVAPINPTDPAKGTLGEWLAAAKKVFAGEADSFGGYARAARQIAREIMEMREPKPADPPKKLTPKQEQAEAKRIKKKYGKKGAAILHRLADATPLSIFNAGDIQAWKVVYVKRAGEDQIKLRHAHHAANSLLRKARALFSQDIVDTIKDVTIPVPLPFYRVKLFPTVLAEMRYRSAIDAGSLLRAAAKDFASDLEAYKVILLALGTGARRAEIDSMRYDQLDCDKQGKPILRMETRVDARRKTITSEESIPLDSALVGVIGDWKKEAKGPYIIEAVGAASSKEYGRAYRCEEIFARVLVWLRAHGVNTNCPLHTLRKEAGSIVATLSDIQAAKQFLRHSSISLTSAYYAENKASKTVNVGDLLSGAHPPQSTQRP